MLSLPKQSLQSLVTLNPIHKAIVGQTKTLSIIECRHKSSSSESYQYLQRSSLPTFKFQSSLPRLPIPELSKTCDRYLSALKPIIGSEQQLNETQRIVNEFQRGEGMALNSKLIQINKRNKNTSYISKPWFDYYLKSRVPLPLNFNPFLAWKDDPILQYNDQLLRTTNLILSAMRFRRSYIERVLEPEVFHLNPAKSDTKRYRQVIKYTPKAIATYVSYAFSAFPLDMSQFDSLFASTRIPKLNCDQLISFPDSRHVAVLKRGQFYTFDVLDSNGDLRDASQILTCLKYIMDLPNDGNNDSITLLTTQERDVWAKAREQLISSSNINKENLHLIDSSLFVICLDDISYTPDAHIEAAHNFLHGCNKAYNYVNRWFDKSFSVMITKDGHSAINFEHSWGDGVAVLRFFNEVFNDSVKRHIIHPESPLNTNINLSKEVKKLDFQLNDETKHSIKEAKKHFIKNTENLDISFTIYDKMNKEYFKMKKLSPDSMFQLGFQMAYYRLFNSFAATYESCSTSAFKHGRTETVRSATTATRDASIAFMKQNRPNVSELRKLLDNCSKKHFQLTKEAAMGQGFDRHLFALKTLAQESGGSVPELFTDKSYVEANQFILSTSTLNSDAFQGAAFGPVVDNGFGCGYGYIFNNQLGLITSSYKPKRSGQQFVDAFRQSLDDIYEVLEKC